MCCIGVEGIVLLDGQVMGEVDYLGVLEGVDIM